MSKKFISVCADDYGLNPGVSKGIRLLVEQKKLSAVSCLVNFPFLQEEANALLKLQSSVQIGLHFNLTEGCFLHKKNQNMPSLKALLVKSNLRRLNLQEIEAELIAQLEAFIAAFKRAPDFIDGHQHVHQFPQIREVLIRVYRRYFENKKVAIRCTFPYVSLGVWDFKPKILAYLGGKAFKKMLLAHEIPHAPCFGGFYDFSQQHEYANLFKTWVKRAPVGTLLMCHPGLQDSDGLTHARQREWAFFNALEFEKDCNVDLATSP